MITFAILIRMIFVIHVELSAILEEHFAPDAVISLPVSQAGWRSELVLWLVMHLILEMLASAQKTSHEAFCRHFFEIRPDGSVRCGCFETHRPCEMDYH